MERSPREGRWRLPGFLVDLVEVKEVPVKAGDGFKPAVGVQSWEDQVILLNWGKGKKHCEGKWWLPLWCGVQSLDKSSYLVELGEGKKALVKTGDGCHPAVGVQCPEESGYLGELVEGKEVLVKAGDGFQPAIGVQSWEDQVTLLSLVKGKKHCEGKLWLPPCSRSPVLRGVWLPCWAGWKDRSPCAGR